MKLKNGLEYVICKLEEKDALAAITYLNEVGGESDFLSFGENEFKLTVEQEEQIIRNVRNKKNSLLIGAFIEDRLVAIASIMELSDWNRFQHRAQLGITVRKAYWNLGLGRKMIEELLDFAKKNAKLEIIELEVSTENHVAIALYESFGFALVGRYKRNFKIGCQSFDAYLMQLDLNK